MADITNVVGDGANFFSNIILWVTTFFSNIISNIGAVEITIFILILVVIWAYFQQHNFMPKKVLKF